ncbi:uroporphyrinogen decarboxylase family protein [Geobacter pelophilus]|uniref:Uroporphyrinogen decarboxylase family protein n=1 Tax=Geoanaerobacter pelophilus TaxID=60036 RepID=A0AAW4L572_9BACT|nr:uroporphyrinogen decarboxylase family protein [Geoanaerobacter pelophilus]MBT0665924.1 uroporphyrinogen decarboxylase family protein [Geoanaerobacter pelophilus]
MTGMERLNAAIKGTPADRIPVFCNLLDQGAKELGLSIEEYYSRGEYVAEAQLKMREKYGYDNLWSLFYVGKEAELLGCGKIIFAKDGPPNVGEMIIKKYDDIAKLQVPDDITSHPAFAEELECLRILKAEAGGRYPICAYLTASMTLPAMLMGMEKWLQMLMMGPSELRDELLAKCSDFFQKQIAAYRAAGADVLVYSNPFGSTDFIPRKFFNELSLPWMERDLGPGGTAGIVYYCGSSRFNDVIEAVINRLGIGAFYLSPMDDIAEGKRLIAGRGLTCGVINDIMLLEWSKDEIRTEVKRMIDAGKTGGKFLFGTLVMPYAIPEANIRAMLEAAYEYGRIEGPQ